jgi:hypothetical protein
MAGGVDFVTHRYVTKVQVRRKKEMGLALFFHRSSSVHYWPRGAAADRRLAPLRSERGRDGYLDGFRVSTHGAKDFFSLPFFKFLLEINCPKSSAIFSIFIFGLVATSLLWL